MYETYSKQGHRSKGTESAGIKVRTPASPGFQQVRSSRSYPGKSSVPMSTYESKGSTPTFVKAGGPGKTLSYPSKRSDYPLPGTKAPFTLQPPRMSKPKEA